jgi:hypothetical protein
VRVLVCGSRYWTDDAAIRRELEALAPDVVIEGFATGADRLARKVAVEMGARVVSFPADWSLGRKAGPIRNQRMLDEGEPDLVLAFHEDLERSRGTRDMVERARRAGVPVRVVVR